MGLDSYWVKPNETKSQPLDFDPPLCFEDLDDHFARLDGWAHFRCRSCEHLIEEITGVSLRSERLDNATVLRMSDMFASFAEKPGKLPSSDRKNGWEYWSRKDGIIDVIRDFARLFRAYGEAGYELRGSW
jgi:hypothetical protein